MAARGALRRNTIKELAAIPTVIRSRRPVRVRTPEVADVIKYPIDAKWFWKSMKAARDVSRVRRASRGCG
eukprot:scaffold12822_cov112-Isochrysis_galbana.AAC.3